MAIIFFDIDGTLLTLDKEHIFPDSAKKALIKAKENGHKIFINTGRAKAAIDKILLDFGFDGLVCGCGTYIEYEGKVMYRNMLSDEECIKTRDELKELGMQTVFESVERLFIEGDYGKGSFLEYIYEYFKHNVPKPIIPPYSDDFRFDKYTTCITKDSDRDGFYSKMGERYNLIAHTPIVIECIPKGHSKATGMEYVAKMLGDDIENCYAFGDSVNDLDMLKAAGHAVAMGNGMPDIFDVVEYKTSDINEDGILNGLIHYGLI